MKTNLKNLKDNMIMTTKGLANKAKDACIDAINWSRESEIPYTVVTIAGIAVEVVLLTKSAHMSNQLLEAEIRSKNAYADKFGER